MQTEAQKILQQAANVRRKAAPAKVIVEVETKDGRDSVVASARRVIEQHREVLIALKNR